MLRRIHRAPDNASDVNRCTHVCVGLALALWGSSAPAQGRALLTWDAPRGCPTADHVRRAFAALGLSHGLTHDLIVRASVLGATQPWHLRVHVGWGAYSGDVGLGVGSCEEAAVMTLRYARAVVRHIVLGVGGAWPTLNDTRLDDEVAALIGNVQRVGDNPEEPPPRTPALFDLGLGLIGVPQPILGALNRDFTFDISYGLALHGAVRTSVRVPFGEVVYAVAGVTVVVPVFYWSETVGVMVDADVGVRLGGAGWRERGVRLLASLGVGALAYWLRIDHPTGLPLARVALRAEWEPTAHLVVSAEAALQFTFSMSGDGFVGVGYRL